MIPGTYPDSPNMGINLKKYQFENLTDDLLDTIKNDILYQVNIYIPEMLLIDIDLIKKFNNNTKTEDTIQINIKVESIFNADKIDVISYFLQQNFLKNEILTILNNK